MESGVLGTQRYRDNCSYQLSTRRGTGWRSEQRVVLLKCHLALCVWDASIASILSAFTQLAQAQAHNWLQMFRLHLIALPSVKSGCEWGGLDCNINTMKMYH